MKKLFVIYFLLMSTFVGYGQNCIQGNFVSCPLFYLGNMTNSMNNNALIFRSYADTRYDMLSLLNTSGHAIGIDSLNKKLPVTVYTRAGTPMFHISAKQNSLCIDITDTAIFIKLNTSGDSSGWYSARKSGT